MNFLGSRSVSARKTTQRTAQEEGVHVFIRDVGREVSEVMRGGAGRIICECIFTTSQTNRNMAAWVKEGKELPGQ